MQHAWVGARADGQYSRVVLPAMPNTRRLSSRRFRARAWLAPSAAGTTQSNGLRARTLVGGVGGGGGVPRVASCGALSQFSAHSLWPPDSPLTLTRVRQLEP